MITWHELKDAREYASLTQNELAHKLGVSVRTIQGWESTGVPPKAEYKVRRELSLALDTAQHEPAADTAPIPHVVDTRPLAEASDWALLDEIGRRLRERTETNDVDPV